MSSLPSSSFAPGEAPSWERAWRDIQPTLSSLRSTIASWPKPQPRIMRVGQLDAELLDQELATTLKEPVNKALGQLGSIYETRHDPEIALIIGAILYKFSMWDNGATYGAKLQDLKYIATRVSPPRWGLAPSGIPRRSLFIHACLTLILPYLHLRIRAYALSKAWPDAPSNDRKRRAWEFLVRMEAVHATLGLVGFIAFLYDGRHRTIADRLIGLRLVPSRLIVRRNVSYEFMNRQMVWHAFTEFLIFLIPLISARKVRRRFARFFAKVTSPSILSPASLLARLKHVEASPASLTAGDQPVAETQHEEKRGKYWALALDQCAICAENASYDIAHLSAPGNTAHVLAALTSSDPSAYRYIPTSRYALRASSRTRPVSESRGANSLRGPTDPGSVDADTASSTNAPPPFPITTPYRTSCGHIYCYFCLSEKIIRAAIGDDADEDGGCWECLRCERRVTSAERVVGIDGSANSDGVDSQDDLSDIDHDAAPMWNTMSQGQMG